MAAALLIPRLKSSELPLALMRGQTLQRELHGMGFHGRAAAHQLYIVKSKAEATAKARRWK